MTDEPLAFGLLLRQFRVAAGISQEQLAERAGLSLRGISDLERGARHTPYLDTVRRLLQALDLDSDGQAALLGAARRRRASSSPASSSARNALPLPLTSFVGRDQALVEVCDRLAGTRLLTLIGVGGIGKTRLALEVARRMAGQASSVALVELAPLQDPTLVPQAVAASLGVRDQHERGVVESLIHALRPRDLLLVLDNCEHVLAECATLATQLLSACPGLRILATSREALAIAGESQWQVPPLQSADPRHLQPLDEMARFPAVRLFLDRASAVESGFVLTEQSALAVANICQKLDGIPLAIELAAARVNVLSASQIAQRLEDRLHLLTSASRTALERQKTIRATLDWSYDLLTDGERQLLQRLAVFAGGWALEACEVVCSGGAIARDDVLDLLARLVDKSLVVVSDDGPNRRYRLLETVREYAQERLASSGESDDVRSVHAAVFVTLGEAAAPQLGSAHQLQWLHRLDVEYDNFRTAVQWLLGRGDIASVLRLAPALGNFGWIRGRLREQRQWWDTCLERCPAGSRLRSTATVVAATIAFEQGDYGRAFPLLEESLVRARREGNKPVLARVLLQLGFAAPLRGDPRVAIEWFTEAEALFHELGQPAEVAAALIGLGTTARATGEYELAETYYERALAVGRDNGNPRTIAQSLQCLGSVAVLRGDLSGATSYLHQAVPLCVELENRQFLGYCALHLAQVAVARGDGRRAARLLGAADGLWRSDNNAIYPTYQAAWARACETAMTMVGQSEFASVFTAGQALSLEHAATLAMSAGAISSTTERS